MRKLPIQRSRLAKIMKDGFSRKEAEALLSVLKESNEDNKRQKSE